MIMPTAINTSKEIPFITTPRAVPAAGGCSVSVTTIANIEVPAASEYTTIEYIKTGCCVHQTLPRLTKRAQELFNKPIYGIVGGLHYPVTDSRLKILGIPVQKLYGTGKPPWSFITMEEIKRNMEVLKNVKPGIVGISSHDSCDESIDAFRKAFPSAYD